MQRIEFIGVIVLILTLAASAAQADNEASNVAHVAASPDGRCYAKSLPDHVYDPEPGPRQQGRTLLYRVGDLEDTLVREFDWFSQRLFIKCAPSDDILVVRLGPWQRGHDPRGDHLAIAFYKGGELVKQYSTLDIAGDERAALGSISTYQNVSASSSHYTVFAVEPELVKRTTVDGFRFEELWTIEATTVDGRRLTFDLETGELQ